MKGRLVNPHVYTHHPEVSVDGHLPSGWGRLVLPSGASYPAYKTAPGDPQDVPAAAIAMNFYVAFFLVTTPEGPELPAGSLHFGLDLRQHPCVKYHAAGVVSTITTAVSGGQGS